MRQRPFTAAGERNIQKQHLKGRMTIWERIRVLTQEEPTILYQNWGENLDGASLVTAIVSIEGREVALYGHDFTVRAGSMDATNGRVCKEQIWTAKGGLEEVKRFIFI